MNCFMNGGDVTESVFEFFFLMLKYGVWQPKTGKFCQASRTHDTSLFYYPSDMTPLL